jgi:hypothetical protein
MKTLIAMLRSLCLLAAIFALAEACLAPREVAKLTKAAAVTVTEAGGQCRLVSRNCAPGGRLVMWPEVHGSDSKVKPRMGNV